MEGKDLAILMNPKVMRQALYLAQSGTPLHTIYKLFKEKYKLGMSEEAFKNAITTYLQKRKELVQSDEKIKQLLKEDLIDAIELFKEANKKLIKLLDNAKNQGIQLKAITEIRKQMETLARMVGMLKTATQEIKINYVQMVNYSSRYLKDVLHDLEQQGYIKILKPLPFEMIYTGEAKNDGMHNS